MKKLCFAVRILTVAPVIALITFSILHFVSPEITGSILNYILAIVFICVLPILAYPLQPITPHFKGKGREGQRTLAIIMSVLGYIGGIICAFALGMPDKMQAILMTYFLSGVLIFLFSKVIKIKASGHACGVAGPIVFLTYVYGPVALLGLPVLGLVYWASLKMGRHKLGELIWGTLIPVASMLVSILFVYIV